MATDLTPRTAEADPEDVAGFQRNFELESTETARQEPASEGPISGQSSPVSQMGAISALELVLGAIALITWFLLFAGGILISSEPYRKGLSQSNTFGQWIFNWLMVMPFWTITNIGFLSCLAAVLGDIGRRTRFTAKFGPISDIAAIPTNSNFTFVHYYSAVMRGFGIYVFVLAGLLVLATKALSDPEQGEYLRLAATMTIVSFYAGYDPELFGMLLARVRSFFEQQPKP